MSGLVRALSWRDWLVPAVLWLAAQLGIWVSGPGADLPFVPRLLVAAVSTVSAAALCLRRRFPLAALTVVVALGVAVTTPETYVVVATALVYMTVVATFACGRYGQSRWRYLALLLPELLLLSEIRVSPTDTLANSWAWGLHAWWVFALGAAFRQEHLLSERVALEAASEAQVAATQQRLAMAREVHDVVSHSLSVVVVQAELAQVLIDTDVAGSRGAMERVQNTGRLALVESRRLLAALRDPDNEETVADPPSWSDVPDLVVRIRQSGLPVTMDGPAHEPELTPEVSAAAYRIVQEALTNVLRHAGSSPTTVNISHEATRLVIDVRDEGGMALSPRGAGHGLSGMRERVSALGGEFTAGPSPTGGYEVRAVLPTGGTL
jgi:signal transduction histidine kinase